MLFGHFFHFHRNFSGFIFTPFNVYSIDLASEDSRKSDAVFLQ